MPGRFRVVATDFLEEASIEAEVLGELASVTCGLARDEGELAELLGTADALMLFHDVTYLSDKSFAKAPRCR
ncbi:MAG TPA: C-terminal binding protein, partial [Isosphaeraceae bacterium]|nr:C-terminal binding protein [Isosphaeraceae bacterium]